MNLAFTSETRNFKINQRRQKEGINKDKVDSMK